MESESLKSLKVSWRFNSPNKYELWNFHGGMKLPKNVSFEFARLKIAKSCEMTRNRYNFQKSKKVSYLWQKKRVVLDVSVVDADDVHDLHDAGAGDDDGHRDYCSHFGCYS